MESDRGLRCEDHQAPSLGSACLCHSAAIGKLRSSQDNVIAVDCFLP